MTAVSRDTLVATTEAWLEPGRYADYCPNGLQVEGQPTVELLVTGVTASQALIDAAIEAGASALLVHHGFFWKGESPCVTGMRRRRLKALLDHGVSLLAYHLPLDDHPTLGNNAQLAGRLGWTVSGALSEDPGVVGAVGEPAEPLSPAVLAEQLGTALDREPLWVGHGPDTVRRIAWCTGAAQGFLKYAVARGADAYVTGEVSEQTVHEARESGIHFYAAGHHATERYGVQALGERLSRELGVTHRFIDCPNPA